MSIAKTVQSTVESMPAGQIFGYADLPDYASSPSAVIKAVSRLVSGKRLERFAKGKFYVAKKGVLGKQKPSDDELVRDFLYKDGRIRGYVTGASLYNLLGLTTQVPRTITLAYNGGRQVKDFGAIRVKTIVTRVPIQEENVELLQYLDVLKGIKNISGSDINLSLRIMLKKISGLSKSEKLRLMNLAEKYYSPQSRALVGLLFSSLGVPVSKSLKLSLNPTTVYKLNLDGNQWPNAKEWNIQ